MLSKQREGVAFRKGQTALLIMIEGVNGLGGDRRPEAGEREAQECPELLCWVWTLYLQQ